jgi:alpha-beta hydrolase superfamily lysophospholipase
VQHSEGTFTGAGGVMLYYQRWLPDGMPRAAVAVVHGFGEHSGRYTNVVNQLTPAGYAVYAMDLRGHGRSPGQRGYINAWAEYRDDVGAFLRLVSQEQPMLPLFLMGHSLGGVIALEYAEHHPEGLRGVVASGPLLGQPGVSPILLALAQILSRIWPRFSLTTGVDASALSRDLAVAVAYRADPLVHDRGTARLGTELSAAQARTLAGASAFKPPLLIIHGGADRLSPPEASRIFFERAPGPDKERHEIPGGYHEPHNDTSRAQALDILRRWLDRHV